MENRMHKKKLKKYGGTNLTKTLNNFFIYVFFSLTVRQTGKIFIE